ncbi:MAG: lipid IV(A) 3-deoxy-D-manno-octulosonic acid transferase [Proteobacteria bacterium]|nr:lipid IV(A) 3-deoxy-D-manno-octulosonic acid transferase [Pseudomonadota bacterium]
MRYIYSILYYLAVPFLLLRIGWRSMVHNKEYRVRWLQRFGFIPQVTAAKVIWVHAVSMGETLAAVPLVRALLKNYPEYQIVITSTTPTGAAQVIKNFGQQVISINTPYDLPGSVQRFLDRTHPNIGIILETELWPNLLFACSKRNLPLMLANARLSERSCRGYRRIASLTQQMVNTFKVVAAQGELDGQRYLSLGLDSDKLKVCGNIKFDIQLPADLELRGRKLREELGSNRPVWVAASTHEGEELVILKALQNIRIKFPDVLLILVPRHPERFAKVGQICINSGYRVAIRSLREPITSATEILLGDTMGELLLFYAAADIAVVGGSFVPIGGHNLIEPAILKIPVLTGPHLDNFVEISQLLIKAGGAQVVSNAEELTTSLLNLLGNPAQAEEMGQKGCHAVLANRGALSKHLTLISELIDKKCEPSQPPCEAVKLTPHAAETSAYLQVLHIPPKEDNTKPL